MIGLDGYIVVIGIFNLKLNGDEIVVIFFDVDDIIDIVYIWYDKVNFLKMG